VTTVTDEGKPDEQRVTTREWVRGLAFVVIAVAAVVGLGAWLVFSFVLPCGCLTPAAGPAVDQARAGQIAFQEKPRRKFHRPRHIREPSINLAIDEIGDAAEKQPERHCRGGQVHQGAHGDVLAAREQ